MQQHVLWVGTLLVCLQTPMLNATTSPSYMLEESSTLEEGCFELCACPLSMAGVSGSFLLVPAGTEGSFEVYEVKDVAWTVASPVISVSGVGSYRLDHNAGLQSLQLELRRDTGPLEYFHSGIVLAPVEFPSINAAVAVHGPPACFDTRFVVRASPQATIAVDKVTWATVKALYGHP